MAVGIYGNASNYMNSINSLYNYNYNFNLNKNVSSASNSLAASYAGKNSYFNTNAMSLVTNIKAGAKNMQSALAGLNNPASYRTLKAVSSNANLMEVNAKNAPSAFFRETKVSINQVATGQTNKGGALDSGEAYAKTGIQQFQLEIGGKKHQFAIDVKAGDTNKSVQQKMASAINSRNIGVTASISENSTDKTSSLTLASKSTGTSNAFAVTDTYGTLAEKTGIDRMTSEAKNAVYSVNGGPAKTSGSNEISLDGGVSVTLKKASEESVTVSSKQDTSDAVNAVKKMVEGYNDFVSNAKGSARLQSDLTSAFTTYAPTLQNLGITANKDGTLAVDSGKLSKAAEDGRLERYFTQANSSTYGFTGRLNQIAGRASANPASYAINSPGTAGNMNNLYNYMYGNTTDARSLLQGYFFSIYA